MRARVGVCVWGAGFNFSVEFRRNSGFFLFPLVTGKRNFGIFRYILFSNSKFNKFRSKFTEIRRNLPKFRNEISFPLNTGISSENEMVNPGLACRGSEAKGKEGSSPRGASVLF